MNKYTKIGAMFGIGLAIVAAVGMVGVFEHNTAFGVPHNGDGFGTTLLVGILSNFAGAKTTGQPCGGC